MSSTRKFIEPMTTKVVGKGQRFGRLVILGQVKAGRPIVLCICDCGNEYEVKPNSLIPNKKGYSVKSCGCLRAEGSKPIHGQSYTAEYDAWHSMKGRCLNPNDKRYFRYGGRGISICPEWVESFEAFFAYVGPRPSSKHSLDRYPNNHGNYEPGNVRWATSIEQNRNTRGNRHLVIGGMSLCVADWSDISGISCGLIAHRLERKWKPVDAVFAPPQPRYRKFYQSKVRMNQVVYEEVDEGV